MRRWLKGGDAAEAPTEGLEMTMSTGSSGNGDATLTTSTDDKTLELWLSISIPLVLLLAFIVVMFFCCKRQKRRQEQVDLEAGSPPLPIYQLGRRRGAQPTKLTEEDEEALATWRIDAESIVPIRPLGAGAYGTVWLATRDGCGEEVVTSHAGDSTDEIVEKKQST
ncbi:LOW QUALITY PROTEIN: TKL protein kinase [Phytophthora palmivora]|uniref:TKL protein kinase n=1 Tax=Phytophthora palmivora TaxID=4796 RepID=A0A2P4X7W7_9STRA|nr:LOW QUALITY PROTEIN: TKL protein kinase [Phytophthora palmivora]